jgi:hypothetical protein
MNLVTVGFAISQDYTKNECMGIGQRPVQQKTVHSMYVDYLAALLIGLTIFEQSHATRKRVDNTPKCEYVQL